MADFAHDETEKVLKALEQKIAHMYDESAKELQEEIDRYFAQFAERDKKIKEQIGKIHNGKEFTEQDYILWRQNQFGRGERLEALKNKLAERATNANEVAISYVNDETPGVYSLNRNYTAYTIDTATGGGMSFHKNGSLNADFILFDEQTVKRLVKEAPDLMPYYPPAKAIKRGIDLEYGKSQITKSITSGIMQGKSIGKIATDLQQHITDMNRTSAVRAARTAMTGAQNAGRQDSYIQAEKMGIKVRKRWIATKDNCTRHSHGMLDGQTVPADEPFVSILGSRMMFPGDASGAVAGDLYNCRCTMRTVEKEGIEAEPRMMRVMDPETGEWKLVEEMTYAEWAGWKGKSAGNFTAMPGEVEQIGNVDFSDKKAVFESLKKAKLESADLSYEVNYSVTYDGKFWKVMGESGAVNPSVIPSTLKGSYSYHNHPANKTGYSFSAEDAAFFIDSGETYSEASDNLYEYFMLRTLDTVENPYDEVYNRFKEIEHTIVLDMKWQGVIDPDLDGYHETMKILSQEMGFLYERKEKNK